MCYTNHALRLDQQIVQRLLTHGLSVGITDSARDGMEGLLEKSSTWITRAGNKSKPIRVIGTQPVNRRIWGLHREKFESMLRFPYILIFFYWIIDFEIVSIHINCVKMSSTSMTQKTLF